MLEWKGECRNNFIIISSNLLQVHFDNNLNMTWWIVMVVKLRTLYVLYVSTRWIDLSYYTRKHFGFCISRNVYCNFVGLLHHPIWLQAISVRHLATYFEFLLYFIWQGSPERVHLPKYAYCPYCYFHEIINLSKASICIRL